MQCYQLIADADGGGVEATVAGDVDARPGPAPAAAAADAAEGGGGGVEAEEDVLEAGVLMNAADAARRRLQLRGARRGGRVQKLQLRLHLYYPYTT